MQAEEGEGGQFQPETDGREGPKQVWEGTDKEEELAVSRRLRFQSPRQLSFGLPSLKQPGKSY